LSSAPRARLAQSVRGVMEHVGHYIEYTDSASARGAPVIIDPNALKDARDGLTALAARLDSSSPVSARGVVLTRSLVRHGISNALFDRSAERTLGEIVAEALAKIEG